MSIHRINKFNHKVDISPISDKGGIYVSWKGFKDRHDYIVAEDLEDLDILITELSQAVYNYKRKQLMHRHNNG